MKLLVDGAQLQCTHGSKTSALSVPPTNIGLVSKATIATVADFAPVTNIPSFGTCSATGQGCVPATSRWSGATSLFEINGVPALTEQSFCVCTAGGTIRAVTAGQDRLEILPSGIPDTRERTSVTGDEPGQGKSDKRRKPDRKESTSSEETPLVFRYAIEVGPGHQWTERATITLFSEDESDTLRSSVSAGTSVGSMRIIEFAAVKPGIRYRGELSEGGMRIPLFGFTPLHGVASETSPENLLEQLPEYHSAPGDGKRGDGNR
ncbi:DUF4280 domain-containing protein [Pendulispora brunnea]|uniref:DUF4280 domain-containing protein n=1 Tax=Pendulispora brunnea TaxID=2905690 RepID=UPI00374E081D